MKKAISNVCDTIFEVPVTDVAQSRRTRTSITGFIIDVTKT